MKERLLELIKQIDKIEGLFHSAGGVYKGLEIINDVQDFTIWLQAVRAELRDIHNRTNDFFIVDAIHDLEGFDGWQDRRQFNKVKGDLFAIREKVDSYYPQDRTLKCSSNIEVNDTMQKQPKIFISHSSKDAEYAIRFTELFDSIGLNREQIFCSSVPGYNIPIDKDIFEYLREQFEQNDLYVIFLLSHNYYESIVCLNEMGAAWALKSRSTTILLPGFNFDEIEGVVSKNKIAIKLTIEGDDIKDKLNQLYENIIEEFGLTGKVDIIWEKKRAKFLDSILKNKDNGNSNLHEKYKNLISPEAKEILRDVVNSNNNKIIITEDIYSGKIIQYGLKCHSGSEAPREFSKWEAAISELIKHKLIEARGSKNKIFVITDAGYKYLESVGE